MSNIQLSPQSLIECLKSSKRAFGAYVIIVLLLAQMIFVPSVVGQESVKSAAAENKSEKDNLPHQYVLANGLKVILVQDKAYPFISCFSWYRVGSRDDPAGATGLTHLVEHLLFQNVGSFRGNQLANTIVRNGGEFSGFTSEDFTAFYSNLPASQLDLAIRAEADRMRSAHFTKKEVDQEVESLVKEASGDDQDPAQTLNREVHALAYERHPYRNPPGGWPSELEHLSYEEARAHYDLYFHPNNASLVLVGDFDESVALKLIDKYFAVLPKATNLPVSLYPQERPQLAERQIKLKAHSGKELTVVAYKVPGVNDADAPVLAVLEQIFNAQMHGRLHSKLVETGLCTSAQASFELKRFPGLFVFNCSGIPACGSSKLIQALDNNLAQLKLKQLTDAEVSQAARLAEFLYYSDGSGPYLAGFQIGFFDMLANEQEAYLWPQRLRQVTAADISRVARRYFNDENRVLGEIIVSVPTQSGDNKPTAFRSKDHLSLMRQERRGGESQHLRLAAYQNGEKASQAAVIPDHAPDHTPVKNDQIAKEQIPKEEDRIRVEHKHVSNKVLSNGINVIVLESHLKPLVQVYGALRAGSIFEPADSRGMSRLIAAILNNGNTKTTKQQQIIEQSDLGLSPSAMLKFDSHMEHILLQTRCLSRDLPIQLRRLTGCLMEPKLENADFETIKNDLLVSLKQKEFGAEAKIRRALLSSLISPNCPYYPVNAQQEIDSISEIKLSDAQDFYREHINPISTTLVIAGDVEAKQVFALMEKLSQGWSLVNAQTSAAANAKPEQPAPWPQLIVSNRQASKSSILLPSTASGQVVLGRIIPVSNRKRAEAIWVGTLLADCVLSGHPIFSRLGQRFEAKPELLSEAVDKLWNTKIFEIADKLIWSIQIYLTPKNMSSDAVTAIQKELKQFGQTGMTPEEFAEAKKYLSGNIPIKECFNLDGLTRFVFRGLSEFNELEPLAKIDTIMATLNFEDVNQFIVRLFKPQAASVIVAGPRQLIKQVHAPRDENESD